MWTRKELKENAKERTRANYWKSVLAALIMAFILGGNSNFNFDFNSNDVKEYVEDAIENRTDGTSNYDFDDFVEETFDEIGTVDVFGENVLENVFDEFDNSDINMGGLIVAIITGIALVVIIIAAIGISFKVFLMNPLEVGGRSFFINNHYEEASVKSYGLAFKSNYLNITLVMFLRDLFTALWSLLFVIPGIIKSYEYRMIPYLLAENPDMTREEAFEESKRMMMGNKWNAFVLDLSFIGWEILNLFTLGILGIFYVNPYVYQTSAELYIKLHEGYSTPEESTGMYDSYVEV